MPTGARNCWRVARAAYWPAQWGGATYYLIYQPLDAAGFAPSWRVNLVVFSLVQTASWLLCGALTVFVGAFAWHGLRGIVRGAPEGVGSAGAGPPIGPT
jgi:hypothetical protein